MVRDGEMERVREEALEETSLVVEYRTCTRIAYIYINTAFVLDGPWLIVREIAALCSISVTGNHHRTQSALTYTAPARCTLRSPKTSVVVVVLVVVFYIYIHTYYNIYIYIVRVSLYITIIYIYMRALNLPLADDHIPRGVLRPRSFPISCETLFFAAI